MRSDLQAGDSTIVTVVIPCLNEEAHILDCLKSVSAFELPSDTVMEIFVLDGMSTDQTRRMVDAYTNRDPRVRLIDNPGRIQSIAINKAVNLAHGAWILRLDAHTYYPEDYLRECLLTAHRTDAANVGGVCQTRAGSTNYGAEVVQALTTHRFGVGNSPFRTPRPEGPADTVPFGFFKRSIFDEVGLFDERLDRMEDFEFNARLRKTGHIVWLNPAIRCFYHNQPTLQAFLEKQFFREAPYNVYLWYLAPYAFAVRHGVTGLFVAWLFGGMLAALWWAPVIWAPVATLGLYIFLALLAAAQQAVRYRRPRHVFVLPLAFLSFHIVHGLGMWVAAVRLAANRAPVQRRGTPWPGANYFRWSRARLKNKSAQG